MSALAVEAGPYNHDGIHLDRQISPSQLAVLRHTIAVGGIDVNRCFSAELDEGGAVFHSHLVATHWKDARVRYAPCSGGTTFITIRRRVELR